ncbi:MAG: hypothetical protein AAGD38_04405 [Acidobacteriota bacterium]
MSQDTTFDDMSTLDRKMVERLSAYIDGELPQAEQDELENRLATDEALRGRLASMRKVVGSLQHLERAAPPPLLGEQVARHIRLDERRTTLFDRIQEAAPLGQPSPLMALLGVVLALAIFIYMLSVVNARRQEQPTLPIVFEHESMIVAPDLDAEQERVVELMRLRWIDGAWREAGLGLADPTTVLSMRSPEAADLVASVPDLEPLLTFEQPVMIRLRSQVVRFEPAPPP